MNQCKHVILWLGNCILAIGKNPVSRVLISRLPSNWYGSLARYLLALWLAVTRIIAPLGADAETRAASE
jgi:hypothetical protein